MSKKVFILVLILIFSIFLPACGKAEEEAPAEPDEEVQAEALAETSLESTYVYMNCGSETVQTGTEIALYYDWLTETKEQNSQYFNATNHVISVDGKPISIKSDGYSGIEKTEDGYFNQRYWMNIGELEPGTHVIISIAEITEKVFDGWDWYGPDTDYPEFENYCTLTIGDETFEGEGVEEPQIESTYCDISNSLHADWSTYLCETFDSDTLLWTGTQVGTTASVIDGEYILDNSTKVAQGYTTGYTFPVFAGAAQDYMISVDGYTESVYKSIAWGVFVRSTESEVVYFFMINNEGQYMLTGSSDVESRRYLGNIDDGSSGAINWEGSNNITAVVEGKQMDFYINGELITSHEAIDSVSPQFGLIVWGGEGVSAINHFDNLLVRVK